MFYKEKKKSRVRLLVGHRGATYISSLQQQQQQHYGARSDYRTLRKGEEFSIFARLDFQQKRRGNNSLEKNKRKVQDSKSFFIILVYPVPTTTITTTTVPRVN